MAGGANGEQSLWWAPTEHTDPFRLLSSTPLSLFLSQLAHKYFRMYFLFLDHKNAQPNCSNYNDLHKRREPKRVRGERGAGGTANGNQKAQSTKVCYAFCNLFMQTTTTKKATQNAANYVIWKCDDDDGDWQGQGQGEQSSDLVGEYLHMVSRQSRRSWTLFFLHTL